MKTQAWVLTEINKLELLDIELPPLEEGQALVEIHYTSACGSQLNEIYGHKGEDRWIPHLLGHELVGIVKSIKDEKNQVIQIGNTVIGTWISPGGSGSGPQNIWCNSLDRSINAGPITSFSRHSIISTKKLISLNEQKPLPEHALLGCAVPTGAGSLRYCEKQDMAIIGLGGVGLAAALEARYKGITVIGIDPNEFKRKCATELQIQNREFIGSDSMWDFILEASGNKFAMESGFEILRSGGTLVLAGNLPKGQKIEIDPFKFIKGCRVRGVVGGDCSHEDILEFASRKDIWKPLISRNYSFEQLDIAIKDLAAGTIIKPIIECQK
jgi:S-(hydroxymethyl)glutathione dehydrogenase/alcohol dehydrogenase